MPATSLFAALRELIQWCTLATVVISPATSMAYDIGANVGVIHVRSLPDGATVGTYPYVAASLAIPMPRVTLLPSLGIEWAPDVNRWGFVGSLVADYRLNEAIGLDLSMTLIHDQDTAKFSDAILLLGGGFGISFFVKQWTFSPSVSFFHGLNVAGWSLVPGLNMAYTF